MKNKCTKARIKKHPAAFQPGSPDILSAENHPRVWKSLLKQLSEY
jgi:hypothetical protein